MNSVETGSVVALAGEGGPAWLVAAERVWDRGAAIAPMDGRLPEPTLRAAVNAVKPTHWLEVASGEVTSLDGEPGEPGDAVVLCTSGTTGQPKAVIHTHDSVAASAAATNQWLGIQSDDHWLACLPLAHIGGLSVVLRARAAGVGLTIHRRFDAAATEASTEGPNPVTRVSLVTRALTDVDPRRFRTILLGGAAPPPNRPANVIATYGMTETGSGVVYDGHRLDGVELRTDDNDQIWVRGDMLFRGYRDGSTSLDDDGWFPTGDLGHWDGSTLAVWGRAGDVINTGAEKVHPNRTESVMAQHPQVAAVAVIGRPDDQWGQRVVAFIEPADARQPPTLDELRDWTRQQLPVWYAPAELVVVDALPRTGSGKVRRADLR